ncbi:hypothetical protein ACSDQ9_03940 [Aestuariimicrobium soli]|uniref:hypothetical protein n=1 Tax=Aestuariimicrobium soli TaxID=2035834 RepID=UPI003EC00710
MQKNMQRSKQVVIFTAPCLVIGIVLMVALGLQQLKGEPGPNPPTNSTSGSTSAANPTSPAPPTSDDPTSQNPTSQTPTSPPSSDEPTTQNSAGLVALRGKKLPTSVLDNEWGLRSDDPTLGDDFDGYYGRNTASGTVSMRFEAGDASDFQQETQRVDNPTKIGVAICGTNPNNNLDYCFLQGADDTYMSFFSSSTNATDIAALVQGIVTGLS